MKLILASTGSGKEGNPPLALGYIASYLRKYLDFNNIKIIDKERDLIGKIIKEKPDVVGISSSTLYFNQANDFARIIKSELDVPTIIGGHHITALPHTLDTNFDIAVMGEGEKIMLNLMKTLTDEKEFNQKNLSKIKGIAFHKGYDIKINERESLIKNLDELPYPARDLFKMKEEYLVPRMSVSVSRLTKSTHILTSRGCPYRCIFCESSSFWKGYRFNSPEYVVGEIKYLIKEYKLNTINIFDDLFIADKERFKKIVELLEAEGITQKCSFRILGRANLINDDSLQLMKRMNVASIGIGFESQSPKVLKYLKKGTTTVEQNKNAVKILNKNDIPIQGLFMLGSPDETKEDMLKTLKFIDENVFDSFEFSITTAVPGSELWDYAKQKNLVKDDMNWDLLTMKAVNHGKDNILLSDKITREDFIQVCKMFENRFSDRDEFFSNLRFSDMMSPGLIKLALSQPKESFGILFDIIKNKMRKNK